MQGVPDAELQLDRLALLLGRCEVTRIKQVAATMIRIWSRIVKIYSPAQNHVEFAHKLQRATGAV